MEVSSLARLLLVSEKVFRLRELVGVIPARILIAKYYSGNQIEKNETAGHVACMGEKERRIQDFGGET
jgi:hypothetical protein